MITRSTKAGAIAPAAQVVLFTHAAVLVLGGAYT
jgi:hypothetical protein